MKKADLIETIKGELMKNGIKFSEVFPNNLIVDSGKKVFVINFFEQTVSIMAYYKLGDYERIRLASVDIAYKDITMLWMNEQRLFLSHSGLTYCVFPMGVE